MTHVPKILVVDDAAVDLTVLTRQLHKAGYQTATAADGEEAWDRLEATPDQFAAVLVDRVMPGISGLELLHRIRTHPTLAMLPVILQTARDSYEDVVEGLKAGAYHYLTKPVRREELLAVVDTAVTNHLHFEELRSERHHTATALGRMTNAEFEFRTVEEARLLASLLSQSCPQPQRSCVGLAELLINAVEHGNLGICYSDKSDLGERADWQAEVDRLLQLPENRDKRVRVEYSRCPDRVEFVIRDEGEGFDWRPYLEFSPERFLDTHGRGIALATNVALDRVEYLGRGNEVRATVLLDTENDEAAGSDASEPATEPAAQPETARR